MGKKLITTGIALAMGITVVGGTRDFVKSENCIDGDCGVAAIHIDFNEALFGEHGCAQKIKNKEEVLIDEISFRTKTGIEDLPEYKAYCCQGILYYVDKNDNNIERSFRDVISPPDEGEDSSEYDKVIDGKSSVKSKFILGKNNPLEMKPTDSTLMFTWCTGDKLVAYDLHVKLNTGKSYTVAKDKFLDIKITDIEETNASISGMVNDNGICLPFGYETFEITSTWMEDRGGGVYHDGVDLCSEGDFTIHAAEDGTITHAGWENDWDHSQGYGQFVTITTDDGRQWVYGHMSEMYVVVGQRVTRGQPIGYEGNTGYSFGDHCHVSYWENGCRVDPTPMLGIPNDYVTITPKSLEDVKNELALKVMSFNKYFEAGSLKANAIRRDDEGAMSLGINQFRGSNARHLLQKIYADDPENYRRIDNKYPGANYIDELLNLDDNAWEHKPIRSEDEFNFYSELLMSKPAIQSQWDFTLAYARNLVDDAYDNGIDGERSILLYSRVCINLGMNSTSANKLRDNSSASFDELCGMCSFFRCDEAFDIIRDSRYPILTIGDIS